MPAHRREAIGQGRHWRMLPGNAGVHDASMTAMRGRIEQRVRLRLSAGIRGCAANTGLR